MSLAGVMGTVTYFLDAPGLVAGFVLVLLCALLIWALNPGHTEALWVIYALSFAALPFKDLRGELGTLLVPVPALVAMVVVGVILLQSMLRRRWDLERSPVLWGLGLLLLGNAISLSVARDPEIGLWTLLKWVFHATILLFLGSMRAGAWHLRTIKTLILVTGILSGYELVRYLSGLVDDVNFYQGIGTRTATGMHISLLLPLAASLTWSRALSVFERVFLGLACCVSFVALGFTFSRTGWVALIVATAAMGLVGRRLAAFGVLALAVVVLTTVAPVEVQERFTSIFLLGEGQHPSVTNALRIQLQWLALDVIWAHPFFGVGLGNYIFEIPSYGKAIANVPHNFYLSVWAEGGLLAFLGLVGMLFAVAKKLAWAINAESDRLGHAVVVGLVGSFVSLATFMLFSDDFNHILVWTVLGLVVSGTRVWGSHELEDKVLVDRRKAGGRSVSPRPILAEWLRRGA